MSCFRRISNISCVLCTLFFSKISRRACLLWSRERCFSPVAVSQQGPGIMYSLVRRPQHVMKHWPHHRVSHDASLQSCVTRLLHTARVCMGNTKAYSHQGSIDIVAGSSHSTSIIAAYFAQHARSAGDCFLLFGNVGAGKSHFRYAMLA